MAAKRKKAKRQGQHKRAHKRWSGAEDRLLTMLWGTVATKTVAKKLTRSTFSVVSRSTRLGLGSPSRGTKSMAQFCRETGYFPRQIHCVLKNLGLTPHHKIDTSPGKKNRVYRQFAITFEQEEAILAYFRKHPDGERIYCTLPGYRTKTGQWGVGNKPPVCHGCKRNDRPHRARGLCGACHMREFRYRREAAAAEAAQ